jgi:L-lactate dehydrogenase complex protein LldF
LLYHTAIVTADSVLRHLPRFAIYTRLNAWGSQREIPQAPRERFRQRWSRNRINGNTGEAQ